MIYVDQRRTREAKIAAGRLAPLREDAHNFVRPSIAEERKLSGNAVDAVSDDLQGPTANTSSKNRRRAACAAPLKSSQHGGWIFTTAVTLGEPRHRCDQRPLC